MYRRASEMLRSGTKHPRLVTHRRQKGAFGDQYTAPLSTQAVARPFTSGQGDVGRRQSRDSYDQKASWIISGDYSLPDKRFT
ncbi:hypothetical protein CBM2625_U10012 [Cupriavidus taiwanensis]|nr:hypothetical protein CBM2625_U10012 [Cupriavidus taiwanensis]SPA57712.1 hypothetical protein CBM2638_U30011 [Cupriavidus taiwanensis]